MTDANPITPLAADTPFRFACHPEVTCFNRCCRDLAQILSPLDVLQLRTALGLTSRQFMDRYTTLYHDPRTGLPVVTLTALARGETCPFVSPQGCTVYHARPASCRLYPMARGLSFTPTGKKREHFALIRESHCQGHGTGPAWTPASWMESQGVLASTPLDDRMAELVALKNRMAPEGVIDSATSDLWITALYDLERFRDEMATDHGSPPRKSGGNVDKKTEEEDRTLLAMGFDRVRDHLLSLFSERADS
jgi:Fe-S-cluster containining protein